MHAGFTTALVLGILALGAEGVRAADTTPTLAQSLAGEGRPEADRVRDAGRKPAEVVAFLGIEPGMTVIDLIAAGGYYTEVLSLAVGPTGTVYAQNSPFVLKMREGANDKALTARLAGDRLANVERRDREMSELTLPPSSMDAALTALNFHDIYNGRGPEAAQGFLAAVSRLLKPGGILGLIDHAGSPDGDDAKLHRIDEDRVVAAVTEAGFEIDARSELLRNPDDDRSRSVFDPDIRGRTDRFVLRLRKPD
ncbi:MAG: SAM-dependent methyltransferase [Myxococcota bacterium]